MRGWHPADIKAALEKKGTSATRVAASLGLGRTSASAAVRGIRSRRLMREIARTIGAPPHEIWPSIFGSDGSPLPRRQNVSTGRTSRNVRSAGAA